MTDFPKRLEEINQYAESDPKGLIETSEKRYGAIIDSVVEKVNENNLNTVIMLAGPSSAGKTTTARILRDKLTESGVSAYEISLDDFYLGADMAPVGPDGEKDFETVEALDLPFLKETIKKLLSGEGCDIPIFDFKTSKRSDRWNHIELKEGDVVIFEGLHALNPVITDDFENENLIKLYISLLTRIYDKDDNIIISRRDARLIRRIVRDYNHRGSSVEKTFELWQKVKSGENKYLFPYEDEAYLKIDSFHPYEECMIRDCAIEILSRLSPESEYYEKGMGLIENLKKFSSIPLCMLPGDSILNEFMK
ncbi:MAG: nucleoside kinase [Clostridiales bacterium]|nr:nucleoside kinase [Clostridiales bacterium]